MISNIPRTIKTTLLNSPKCSPVPGLRFSTLILFLMLLVNGCSENQDPAASIGKGRSYLESGDIASALVELRAAAQANGENGEIRHLLGSAHYLDRNYQSAVKELTKAKELGIKSSELDIQLANALIKAEELDSAADFINANQDSDTPEWLLVQADLDLAVGRYEEAMNTYDQIFEADEANIDAATGAITARMALGKNAEATNLLNRVIKSHPDNLELRIMEGKLAMSADEYETAVAAFTAALELSDDPDNLLFLRATAKNAQKDYAGAREDWDKLGETIRESASVIYLDGIISFNENRVPAAIEKFKQVLRVAPNHPGALLSLAKAHSRVGDYLAAEEALELLINSDPGNVQAKHQLAAHQIAMGRISTELGDLGQFDIDRIDNPKILEMIGSALLKNGKLSEASQVFEKVFKLQPDNLQVKANIARRKIIEGEAIEEGINELIELNRNNPDWEQGVVHLALAYVFNDELSTAMKLVDERLRSDPTNPSFLTLQGELLALNNDLEGAVAAFRSVHRQNPELLIPRMNLSRALVDLKQFGEAEEILTKILEQTPGYSPAYMVKADIAWRQGDTEKSIEIWQRIRSENRYDIDARVMLARHYYATREFLKSAEIAEEAFNIASFAPDVQRIYAKSKLSNGEIEPAIAILKLLAERYPDDGEIFSLLELAHAHSGDDPTFLNDVISRSPESVQSKIKQIENHIAQGNTAEAKEIAEQLASAEKTKALGLSLLGEVYFAAGKNDLAAQQFALAHAEHPTSLSVVRIYRANKTNQGSLAILEDWLAKNKNDVIVRFVKAKALIEAGNNDLAIQEYRTILSLAPNHAGALNNLAYLLHQNEDPSAINYAKRAFEANPRNPAYASTYGDIILDQRRFEQAVNLFGTAVQGAPENGDLRVKHALALLGSGDKQSAIKELNAALGLETPFSRKQEARTLLKNLTTPN